MDRWMPVPPEESALPVYAKIVYRLSEKSPGPDYEPGRIITNSHYIDWADQPMCMGARLHPDLPDLLGPNDIVYVPLYEGITERGAEGTKQPGEYYDYNLEQMARFASKVKAIIIGNAGIEMTFKHFWWRDPMKGPRYASQRAADFIREVSAIVRGAGGRPAFGTIDWDLALDCYRANWELRQAIIETDAIQVCFQGWRLITGEITYREYYTQVSPPEGARPENGFVEEDMPQLREYLTDTYTIAGVGRWEGFRNGNDLRLRNAGFAAGHMGVA